MALLGNQYRQGDVLLVATTALPADVEPVAFAATPLALVPAAPGSARTSWLPRRACAPIAGKAATAPSSGSSSPAASLLLTRSTHPSCSRPESGAWSANASTTPRSAIDASRIRRGMAQPSPQRISADGAPEAPQPRTNPVAAALTDLYLASHLRPPTVLVARDAVHFGQIIGRVAGSFGFVEVMSCMLLGCVLVTMFLPPAGSAFSSAYGASIAALAVPAVLASRRAHRGNGAAFGAALPGLLVSLFLGAAVAGTAGLAGAGHQMALLAGGLAMGAGACVQLAFVLLAPCFARWRLSRTVHGGGPPLSWAVLLRGAARADTIVAARLASALDEVEQAHGAGNLRGHRSQAQWAMQAAIREAAQDLGIWSSGVGLVLGQSVGYSSDPAARVGALASAGIDPAGLPRILRPALELDHRVEAVTAFRCVAVVLPAGAPATFTPRSIPGRPHRRSGRLPWCEALRWLGDAPLLALLVDLAPSDAIADWLLARRLARLPEAEQRTPAIRALGVSRTMAALRLRPIHEDDHGRLYQVGRLVDPSAFVAVRDRVLHADGTPLEHWIAVPPHAATAREAVAWSFGMGEAEYRPTKEV